MKTAMHTLALLSLVLVLTSCVSFPGKRVTQVEDESLVASKSSMFLPAVAVRFQMIVERRGQNHELSSKQTSADRLIFHDLVEKTHLVRRMDDERRADYVIEAVVRNNADSHHELWFWSTALSIGLIPYLGTNYLTLEVTIKDRMGKQLRSYVVQDQYAYWFHMFLLPITPFYWPDSVQRDVRVGMYRDFVKQLVEDGLSFSM